MLNIFASMSKVIEFAILCEYAEALEKQVNEYISQGWEPLGGIAVDPSSETNLLYQAMIRSKA